MFSEGHRFSHAPNPSYHTRTAVRRLLYMVSTVQHGLMERWWVVGERKCDAAALAVAGGWQVKISYNYKYQCNVSLILLTFV